MGRDRRDLGEKTSGSSVSAQRPIDPHQVSASDFLGVQMSPVASPWRVRYRRSSRVLCQGQGGGAWRGSAERSMELQSIRLRSQSLSRPRRAPGALAWWNWFNAAAGSSPEMPLAPPEDIRLDSSRGPQRLSLILQQFPALQARPQPAPPATPAGNDFGAAVEVRDGDAAWK